MMKKSTREERWNFGGTILVCSKEINNKFPEPLRAQGNTRETIYGTTYRFQEEDAADGTSFAPSDQGRRTRHFLSSKTKHSTINTGMESATTRPKEEDLTTFTTRLSPSSFRPVSFN